MTPVEFNASLRNHVAANLKQQIIYVKHKMSSVDPEHWSMAEGLGDLVARQGWVDPAGAQRWNQLGLAIYRNPRIDSYLYQSMSDVYSSPEIASLADQIRDDPASLSEEQLQGAADRLLRDERYTFGYMRVLLDDADIRRALGFPEDMNVDRYLEEHRRILAASSSFREYQQKSKHLHRITVMDDNGGDGGSADPDTSIFAAIFAVLAVAVVHTVAVLVNYAAAVNVAYKVNVTTGRPKPVGPGPALVSYYTTAGLGAASRSGQAGVLPPATSACESRCLNSSPAPVWVITGAGSLLKRVPLEADTDSAHLGLSRVIALVIGGKGNPVRMLRLRSGEVVSQGAYMIFQSLEAPGALTLREHAGIYELECNQSQCAAEDAGVAGYSDLDGGGTAGKHFDGRFNMGGIAAALPAGMPIAEFSREMNDAAYFTRVMRQVQRLRDRNQQGLS